jgi:general secretion pathway protein I
MRKGPSTSNLRSHARGRASTSSRVLRLPRAGFTLIEVMIAVVILAIGLSSLFASEAGAIRVAQRARTTTVATLLARCKMGEVEEKIAKEGWPGSALDGRDECCVDAEHEGFKCEWKVERIVLPDSSEAQTEDQAKKALEQGKGGQGPAGGAGSGGPTPPMGAPLDPSKAVDPTSAMGIPLTGLPPILGGSGDPSASGMGMGMGGGDPIASMVMQFAFPIMKPIIEEQVRRVTVNVSWKEGSSDQNFEVVQFLVNELPMLAPTVDEENEQPVPGQPGQGGQGNQTGQQAAPNPSSPPAPR